MNFCPNCGTKITNPDDQFCMGCGQKLLRQEDLAAMQNAASAQSVAPAQEPAPEAAYAPAEAGPAGPAAEPAAPPAYEAPLQTMPAAQEADLLGLIDDGLAATLSAAPAPEAAAPPAAEPDMFAETPAAPAEFETFAEAPAADAAEGGFFAEEAAQAPAPPVAADAAEGGFFAGEAAPAAPAQPDMFAEAAPDAPAGGFFGGETAAPEAPTAAPAESFFEAAQEAQDPIQMDELETPVEIFDAPEPQAGPAFAETIIYEAPAAYEAPPAGEPFAGEIVEPYAEALAYEEPAVNMDAADTFSADVDTAPAESPQEMPVQRMPEAAEGPSLFDFDDSSFPESAPAAEAVPEAAVFTEAAEPEAFDAGTPAPTENFAAESPAFEEPAADYTPAPEDNYEAPAAEVPAEQAAPEAPAEMESETAPSPADEPFDAPVQEAGFQEAEGFFATQDVPDEAPAPAEDFFTSQAAPGEAPAPAEGFFADQAAPDETPAPTESFFATQAAPDEAPAPAENFFGGEADPANAPVGGFFAEVPPEAPADAPASDAGFFAPEEADPAPAEENLFGGQAASAQPMFTEELFRQPAPPEEAHTENLFAQAGPPDGDDLFAQEPDYAAQPQQPYVQQYPTQEPVQQHYTAPSEGFEMADDYPQRQQPPAYDIDRYSDSGREQPPRTAKGDGKNAKRDKKQPRPSGDELRSALYEDEPDPRADPRVARRAAPPPVTLPEVDHRPRRSTGSRVLTFILVVLLFIVLTLGVAFVMLYLNNRPSKMVDDFMEAVAAADVEELESLVTVSGTSPNAETWAAFCDTFEPTANANSLRAQLLMMAGDEDTDPTAMPYPAVGIQSRPFILFIQKYSITVTGVELLAPGAAEGTVAQLNDSTYAGVATAEGVLYQNLMPGQYECRVAAPGVDPASVSPVQVTIFEIDEPNLVEGAVPKATVTIENCASDDAVLYVNDMPVETKPSGGIVTLEEVSVGSVIRIVAQVDGAAQQASVTFDNADVTTLRFDNYAPVDSDEPAPPDSVSEDTEAYKFAAALTPGEINSTLATFYASYLKAINEQEVEQIQLATASGKTSMESRITSSANASNLFEFVSADCNTATITPADENGTSVVRFEATFKYKYRERPEEGEQATGEQTEGSNVQNVELVYQDGKWLVNKMERKEG